MTYIELDEQQRGLTRSQTVNSLVAIFIVVGLMGVGLVLRNNALAATVPFLDETSGVSGQIPAAWLVSQASADYVLQAEDPGAVPFKTLLRVAVLPVGDQAEPRNVVDTLTLQRAARLSNYGVLAIEPILLGEDLALELDYAYVQTEANPFLNSVPLVVRGRDVVVIRGNQAIVITYREERGRFAENEPIFESFLASLVY